VKVGVDQGVSSRIFSESILHSISYRVEIRALKRAHDHWHHRPELCVKVAW
jgi:hypothetical protein